MSVSAVMVPLRVSSPPIARKRSTTSGSSLPVAHRNMRDVMVSPSKRGSTPAKSVSKSYERPIEARIFAKSSVRTRRWAASSRSAFAERGFDEGVLLLLLLLPAAAVWSLLAFAVIESSAVFDCSEMDEGPLGASESRPPSDPCRIDGMAAEEGSSADVTPPPDIPPPPPTPTAVPTIGPAPAAELFRPLLPAPPPFFDSSAFASASLRCSSRSLSSGSKKARPPTISSWCAAK